ncbi:GNAT family N-acetyltransferase [Neomicrococcus aestuarii]|uniref:N-acetyltransferase n=1 Tax=Neomicrococcus aestuarii TaxID=556325 RepID=A0A1L2ZLT9_9MICC|nr:GNAT family N-acetyltransferase [Neomicrococcus aestuarii]APF40405.1 N-acetyltransferase [Neomicrococcus aestuarii]
MDSATLPEGFTIRPWEDGDDLRLLEVWGDPTSPQAHEDRTMLRANSNKPWARTLVVEDQGIPVAAGTIYASSLHPDRNWVYVEVAREHRRQGIGTELMRQLRAEAASSSSTEVKTRFTFAAGTGEDANPAEVFTMAMGMAPIMRSRLVVMEPEALSLPVFDDNGLTLEEIATGSVELTRVVADFYNATHAWDRSEMTLGRAQTMLLGDHTGAKGCIVLRDKPKAQGGRILTFAVSYEPARVDAPADVLIGWDPALADVDIRDSVRGLLAMLVHQYPVQVEVDDSMEPLSDLVDALLVSGSATVIATTIVVATDAGENSGEESSVDASEADAD